MDLKKRWCLLLTVLFFSVVIWEKLSKCSECFHCSKHSKDDPEVFDRSTVIYEQSKVMLADCTHSEQKLMSSEVVYDCVTWEVSRNLTGNIELIPLSAVSFEAGEEATARRKTFQKIFDTRDWPADDPSYGGLKASGPGAMMRNAQGAVAALHSLITRLKSHLHKSVISILDVPCGDLQWMNRFLLTRMDIDYTGADIVPNIVKHHQKKFRHYKNAKFVELDIVSSSLNGSFDLIFCRNLLQHLWMSDALTVLRRFSNSGSRFLLVTTFHDTVENLDVEKHELGGRKSNYNLEIPPFTLGPPICTAYDWSVEHLNLWSLPLMQKKLSADRN